MQSTVAKWALKQKWIAKHYHIKQPSMVVLCKRLLKVVAENDLVKHLNMPTWWHCSTLFIHHQAIVGIHRKKRYYHSICTFFSMHTCWLSSSMSDYNANKLQPAITKDLGNLQYLAQWYIIQMKSCYNNSNNRKLISYWRHLTELNALYMLSTKHSTFESAAKHSTFLNYKSFLNFGFLPRPSHPIGRSAAGRVATSQPGTKGSYCLGTTAHRNEQIKHGDRSNAAD